MDDEEARWRALAALLPPDRAREVLDCREIGEQEAALDLLVEGLMAADVAITGEERARIAVTAEEWGVRESVEPVLRRCRSREGGRVRVVDGEPVEDSGLVEVPWLACTRCDRVLSRVHRREPWGGLSYLVVRYVVSGRSRGLEFPQEDAWAAFTALTSCAAA